MAMRCFETSNSLLSGGLATCLIGLRSCGGSKGRLPCGDVPRQLSFITFHQKQVLKHGQNLRFPRFSETYSLVSRHA